MKLPQKGWLQFRGAVHSRKTLGRVDATQDQVEVEFYKTIELFADGFRNYIKYPEKIDENDI